jgi:para-aminobenzoate synthetase component 1
MYAKVLTSYSKDDFLNLCSRAQARWETDVLFSGDGYAGEEKSICLIEPSDRLVVGADTSADDIKSFAFSDDNITFGFLSYDYGLMLKGIVSDKEQYIEYGHLKKYAACAEHIGDKLTIKGSQDIIDSLLSGEDNKPADAESASGYTCNMSADEYTSKVAQAIEYIRDGLTYQLNLSMMFEAEMTSDPFRLWSKLAKECPAPFYSFFNTISGQIISTSPERFLKVTDGKVMSQPIKGTYRFDHYDESLHKHLIQSRKESAELSMIVDLIRNDISETCEVGSVQVDGHKLIMRVDNLLQMYSNVSGRLRDDKDVVDLLISAFPGGSITGCPKKSSMELIESLEPHSRGVYCGSFVLIEDEKNMDSSIAIRTGFCSEDKFRFFAGSGIVAASKPDSEYKESVSKAEKFLELF